jgi:hypothetical protein
MSEQKNTYETEEKKQAKMEFSHFQEVEGKKRVTLFTLTLDLQDMRHTVGVQFGDLQTSLNAHDALKLLDLLESHRETITALSQQLDAAAMSDDMRDMEQIKREWYAYRHEGDETGPMV